MKVVKSIAAALALLTITLGSPLGLLAFGRLRGLLTLSAAELTSLPDDGRLLLGVLTLVGWVAWFGWLVALVAELVGRLLGRRWRLPSLGLVQGIVASLIVAVLAAQPSAPASAAPVAPSHAQVVDVRTPELIPALPTAEPAAAHVELADGPRYTVAAGDDLWSIAERVCGDGMKWRDIVEANPQITDPGHIEAGWQLVIPGQPSRAPSLSTTGQTAVEARSQPIYETEPTRAAPIAPAAQTREELVAAPDLAPALGLGAVTAAGVLAGLALRRRRQQFVRAVGRRSPEPEPDAARLETVLGAAGAAGALHALEHAQRRIAAHAREEGLPRLVYATASDEGAVFHLAAPAAPPPGFSAHESAWTLAVGDCLAELPDAPLAFPALVPVGVEPSGATVYVDVEEAGILALSGGSTDAVAQGLLVGAAALPWSEELNLTTTSRYAEVVLAAEAEVTVVDDVSDAVVGGPIDPDCRALRLHPDRAAELAPHVAVVDADLPRLRPGPGTGVVLPRAAAEWCLDIDAGLLRTPTLTLPLTPVTCTPDVNAQLTNLYTCATTDATEPAPWWPDDPDGIAVLRPGAALPRPHLDPETLMTAPPAAPELLLLGPIELVGCAGTPPTKARRQCVEYVAWLLEHPGGTSTQMSAAMIIAEGTRRSNVSRVRAWLGTDGEGNQFLPEAYSGRMELHPSVTSDWHRLQALLAPGVNRCRLSTLTAALSLVRGAPLADAAPGQWHWAEPMRSDMVAIIRDVGVRAAELAQLEGDVETVRWVTARALAAAPEDELLLAARIRAEASVGNRGEVERLAWRLTRHARQLGVELREDTVMLLQEAMEGQVRARAV